MIWHNEIDPFAAAWSRELMAAGLIPHGEIDTRSVLDVRPVELAGYRQCHFFAGISVWPYALKLAGWPVDREVWTGSCPCQPFSAAGKREGFADERHLWPLWFHHIDQRRPQYIFGEQVASKDGLAWLDLVQADLEGAGYTVGAVDTCAAGFGAPHIRQRLYWVAYAEHSGCETGEPAREGTGPIMPQGAVGGMGNPERISTRRDAGAGASAESGTGVWSERHDAGPSSQIGGLEHAPSNGRLERRAEPGGRGASSGCGTGGLADMHGSGRTPGREGCPSMGHGATAGADRGAERVADAMHPERRKVSLDREDGCDGADRGRQEACSDIGARGEILRPGPTNGFWRDADWLGCRDGKWRAARPGSFPLAHAGAYRNRVATLRGAGNALNLAQATEFISAVMAELGIRSALEGDA